MRGFILPALAGLGLIAGAAAAQPAVDTDTLPASKVFPYLDVYLGLPPAERDHFRLDYGVVGNGPLANVHLTLKRPSGDVPMTMAADGRIQADLTLADFKSAQVVMTTPKGSHYGIALRIVASSTPAETMEVAPLKAGIDQARTAARKAAGLLAIAVPDFQTVCFVGSGTGQAQLADGKTVALKISAPQSNPKFLNPCLTPADLPQAKQVILAHAPTVILIMRRPAT